MLWHNTVEMVGRQICRKSLRGERGLMYLNGKAMVIDDLWKNGTAPAAYWLWRRHIPAR